MPEDWSKPEAGPRRPYRAIDSDETLISACLAQDSAAWNALISRYQGLIFSIALRRGLSRADAEDVFQNVCVKLYEHLGDLRDVRRLSGWVGAVAGREAAQLYRKDSARLLVEAPTPFEEGAAGVSMHAAPTEDPEEEILALERLHYIRMTIDELSEDCRQLLTLLYATDPGASYTDVAERMSIPLGSIGPRRARCLARLRAMMKEHGF